MSVNQVAYSAPTVLAILAAGAAAGFINAIVGSGTLISFPTLLGLGFAEKAANIANGTGLVAGSLSAVAAQRPELVGQQRRLFALGPASLLGGATGAVLLLTLPTSVFKRVVPFLILFGVALVAAGPRVNRWTRNRVEKKSEKAEKKIESFAISGERIPWALLIGIFVAGVYGGYFGAGQGIILMGLLGIGIDDSMARLNATKNVLSALVNGVAAVVFIFKGSVLWPLALLVGAGSIVGGQIGARLGRRIPPNVLRGFIVVIGLTAALRLLVS